MKCILEMPVFSADSLELAQQRVNIFGFRNRRAALTGARKLAAAKHEARLDALLGPANRAAPLRCWQRSRWSFSGLRHSGAARSEATNPESRDSPMCNCTSAVWSFGPSRNDGAWLMRAYPLSTKITLISLTLVSVGPVSKRSPVAAKNAVASLLSR